MRQRHLTVIIAFLYSAIILFPVDGYAQQKMDAQYAKKIREYTTSPDFLNDLVDHLPVSKSIPSPLRFFGTIIGAPDTLHYAEQIYRYMRAVAKASPRVMVRSIGKTEEGREMIEVFVSDAENIRNLESYRKDLNRLANPRTLKEKDAKKLITKALPVYYLTAGLHSPETGSPEMVMELVYRLATEDSPLIQSIRKNVIVGICPVAEPDGRDRVVEIYRYRKDHQKTTPYLTYWGHYVGHDNNRDSYGMALDLTKNILNSYLHWKPTIMHDLHESIPFLYVQTGMGPYNPYFDATTVDEWNKLAYHDVDELTRRDMPGVWTWGFFNGWAGNYLVWIANNHNSIGRFYETFGNSIPETVERKLDKQSVTRQWYRMNPPLKKTKWSLRDNTNYMESGVLSSLGYVAQNRETFLYNFYRRSRKAVSDGNTKAPYAFVIPKKQSRPIATAHLINFLMEQGIEVRETDHSLSWKLNPDTTAADTSKSQEKKIEGGAYVVRMDQPYRTLIGTLLDVHSFPKKDKAPYDDVGWTLPYLYGVNYYKISDKNIYKNEMSLLKNDISVNTTLEKKLSKYYLVDNSTDDAVYQLRFQLASIPLQVLEKSVTLKKQRYNSGSLFINVGTDSRLRNKIDSLANILHVSVTGLDKRPDVPMHDADMPRIALVHTWIPVAQNAGWWRVAFDKLGVPYHYLSVQDLATITPNAYDVIIIPDFFGTAKMQVQGLRDAGNPMPWMKSSRYPNIGIIDQTPDQRTGMGFQGLANLKAFLDRGGVLITDGSAAELPVNFGLTRRVSIKETPNLETHGSIFKVTEADSLSPLLYGYSDTLAVYFNQSPVFAVDKKIGGNQAYMYSDSLKNAIWNQEVPRVILNFAKENQHLLLSGMLRCGKALGGAPALVDAPVGKGHVLLFAMRPFWRWETRGSHALLFNALLNWNDLRIGWPKRPEKEDTEENTGSSF